MKYTLINPVNQDYSPLEQILTNRGIKYEDINHYLNVSEEDNLSPLLLDNIAVAADMLIKHINLDGNVIMVQVDCDCDGYTSSALLLNYIYKRFPHSIDKFKYFLHDDKSHGIDINLIPELTSLVIAPDSSSNEYEIHKELRERGIDVLVLDHHLAEKVSEYACVVNNQLCDYPNKSLSGVGIVYKLCQYIDSIYGDDIVNQFLDLVGLGLVGDMVSLTTFETHYLVEKGIHSIKNPFIKGMSTKNAYSIGDVISPIKVAFYIVPLINSIARVGTMEEKKLLFESMLEYKAQLLIPSTKRGHKQGEMESVLAQTLRNCTNVKNRQTKEQDAAVELIENKIQKENLLQHKVLIIKITKPSFDKGITGLIANKLMAKYQRPVGLLVSTDYEGKKSWMGSARGYDKSELTNFRQFCADSNLVFLAQGHSNAFGLGIYDENLNKFIEYADEVLKDVSFDPVYRVDFIYNTSTIKSNEILEISDMKSLWGQNVEECLVAIENIAVTKNNLLLMSPDKHPTLKITLNNGISLIKFKSSEKEYNTLFSELGCTNITVVGRCEKNVFNGKTTPQIIIEDYEIINKQNYYF